MTVEWERTPVPALRPFVRSLSVVRSDASAGRERVIPVGSATLLVNLAEDAFRGYADMDGAGPTSLGGAILTGPRLRAKVVDREGQRALLRVAFVPGGLAALLPVPVSETADGAVELGELWGTDGLVLRERLLLAPTDDDRLAIVERFLLDRIGIGEARPFIATAAHAIGAGTSLARTAAAIGLSERRLALHFRAAVGLPPARFRRVRRLQRLLGAVGSEDRRDWARLAQEHGFYDQAHLVNDFRDLTGITPTAYRPRQPAERLVA